MIPLNVRLENFLNSVSFFADERRQRKMWIDGDPENSFLMSLGELYAQFFDDNDIDNFISDELDAAALAPEQKEAIRSFRDALNNFSKAPGKQHGLPNDAELVDDPEWRQLVALANTTLAHFLN